MKFSPLQGALWILIYLGLAIAPMVVAFIGPLPEPRSFWVEFSVGLGFVGLAIMGLQFVLTGRFRGVAATLGLDSMLQYHRQAGLVAFVFIFAHPLILFLTDASYLEYLDPRVNLPRALALSGVMGALVLVIGTTFWRQPLGLAYEYWRLIHGVLALFIVFVGLVHILQVGFYISVWWKQALWILLTVAAIALLVNTRIVRPWKLQATPYRVADVEEERGEAWTLTIEPEGHAGMPFKPGQFAWLTLGPSAFTIDQHPFSFSSSATRPDSLKFTVKALGDFTTTIGDTRIGTRAYLEGPYGAFTPDPEPTLGAVFIAGGVGITPIMSMLRTFRDTGDPRPSLLIYGTPGPETTLFLEELESLQNDLDLTVLHVFEEPPQKWSGERGLVTAELLARHLPADPTRHEYFVCGPEPMMDLVEPYLRERGVPLARILAERFTIV